MGRRAARIAGSSPADQADHGRPHDALHQQLRRDGKSERHLAETLPVHRRGMEIVEGEVGQPGARRPAKPAPREVGRGQVAVALI